MTHASAARAGVTRAGPATTRGTDLIRPFAGWLVRAEAAADEVSAMSEIAVAVQSAPRAVRPDAYEPMPPALYIYRQSTPHGGEHIGIVCDITPAAFLNGRVRGHESVQPDRVNELARYLETVPQRVELVSTLHRAGPVLQATLTRAPALPPTRDITGPNRTRHTVWQIPDGPQTEQLCRELGAATHYIADGHHRVAANLEVWARSGHHPSRGVLCVTYPLHGLQLASFNRRVAGPIDPTLIHNLLDTHFDLHPTTDTQEALASGIAVNLNRRWYIASHPGQRPPGSAGLDISLLHDHVLDRLPTNTEIEPTRAPIETLLAACDTDGGILFALPPPQLETLTAIADAGQIVPAKSTYFSPKPGSGIFLRNPGA